VEIFVAGMHTPRMTEDQKPGSIDEAPKSKGTTEIYECLACESTQQEPRTARTRSLNIRCRRCGRAAYPRDTEPVAPEKPRHCKTCGTKLRSTNTSTKCSLCGDR